MWRWFLFATVVLVVALLLDSIGWIIDRLRARRKAQERHEPAGRQ